MATERQIAANRANAQRSTGPKTTAGRNVSRYNALKHGLSARSVLIQGEYPHQFDELRERLYEEHDPQSIIEEQLVDLLATSLWRLRRIPALESAAFNWGVADYAEIQRITYQVFNSYAEPEEDIHPEVINELANGFAIAKLLSSSDLLGKLNRYEVQLFRQVDSVLKRLEEQRAKRAKED